MDLTLYGLSENEIEIVEMEGLYNITLSNLHKEQVYDLYESLVQQEIIYRDLEKSNVVKIGAFIKDKNNE